MIENQNFRYPLGTDLNLQVRIKDANGSLWTPTGATTWDFVMTDGTNTLTLTESTISYSTLTGLATVPVLGSATDDFDEGDYDWELKATDNSIPASIARGTVTALKVIA